MSNDIFEGASGTNPSSTPEIKDGVDYFSELVGEGKRYKDPVAAGRALVEKDAFIEKLKAEAEEARTELKKRMELEALVAKIAESSARTQPSASTQVNQTPAERQDGQTEPLNIQKMIADELAKHEGKTRQEANVSVVKDKLKQLWGNDYASKLVARANELGVTKEYLNQLAAQSPSVLLAVVGVDRDIKGTSNLSTPPRSTTNPASLNSGSNRETSIDGTRTRAYYDALKTSDPKTYWDRGTQSQMHKDAMKLKDRFFN